MKRVCIRLPIEAFIGNMENVKRNIELYVDKKNSEEILNLCKYEENKKFRRILGAILSGENNPDLYGEEDVSSKAKYVKAMKFGKKKNLRVYCKEFKNGVMRIVLVEVYAKKAQKASNKRLKNKLEAIGGYEYEFK